MENLIVVEQLPIIAEKLESIKNQVIDRVKYAETCACTLDTVKEIKKYRTELKKEFDSLEEQRKAVKTAVLKPYSDFEEKYKECITSVYTNADRTLKSKIDEVENSLKTEKETAVKEYFDEYVNANNIDWLSYERAGITVTLSVSEKKLKEEAKAFADRVVSDIAVIDMQEADKRDEIMIEYKKSLNLKQSVQSVIDRHEQLKRIKQAEEERKQKEMAEKEHVQKIDEAVILSAPKVEKINEEPDAEKLYTAPFKVTGTLEQLKKLKTFLEEGGYKYEC